MPQQVIHGLIDTLPRERLFDGGVVRSGIRTDGALVTLNYMYPSVPEIPEHDHPFDQLALCIGGRMEVTVAGEVYTVESGGFCYIPKSVPHSGRWLEGDPLLSIDIFAPPRKDWLHLAAHQPD